MNSIFKKVGFFTAFIIPGLVVGGFYLGGAWNFLSLVFSFVIIPLIDHGVGKDSTNLSENEVEQLHDDFYYRFVTYVWTYVQVGFICWTTFVITTPSFQNFWEVIGFTIGVALVTGGIGITVAHELGHKQSSLEKFYSRVLLMTVSYMHFYIEHNRGHHVSVATPADPATAHYNENFYAFWMRSVFKGYHHAWRLEKEQLSRKNHNVWSGRNAMIWYALLPVLFCATLCIAVSAYHHRFAWEVPVFFFAQSFLAFSLLELVNYVEHYGIMRKEIMPGKYERVNPLHSWNANHLVSNFFLFQLQRHSDHHAFAYKRYQLLNHYDQSPQLPFGYPTMIILALFPPLWFSMMNARLLQWHETNR